MYADDTHVTLTSNDVDDLIKNHHHSVTTSSQKIRRYSSPVVTIFSSSYALLKV